MKKIIYRKSDLRCVGTLCADMALNQEVKLNVIPNFGGDIEDYSTIETDIDNFHLENRNGKIIIVENKVEFIPKSQPQKSKEELQAEEIEKLKQELKGMQQAMAELSAMATVVVKPKE